MSKRKLGRKIGHRKHLLANLATSLILYEKIKTTQAKAKEVRGLVEKMINLAKRGDLVSRRYLLGYSPEENAVKKLFEELVPRYKERIGGYLKIYKLGPRLGDGSKMVIMKLIPHKQKKEESAK